MEGFLNGSRIRKVWKVGVHPCGGRCLSFRFARHYPQFPAVSSVVAVRSEEEVAEHARGLRESDIRQCWLVVVPEVTEQSAFAMHVSRGSYMQDWSVTCSARRRHGWEQVDAPRLPAATASLATRSSNFSGWALKKVLLVARNPTAATSVASMALAVGTAVYVRLGGGMLVMGWIVTQDPNIAEMAGTVSILVQ